MSDTRQTLLIEEAIAAVERCKFVCRPGEDGEVETSSRTGRPRELVHCFLGSLGADWDTWAVYEELPHAEAIYWGDSMFGVCLCIDSKWDKHGWDATPRLRTYVFDTVTPQ